MSFDLNDKIYDNAGIKAIFNNGVAGKTDNVSVSVEKRKPEDPSNMPEYKVLFKDSNDAVLNLGFFIRESDTKQSATIQRIKSIANAVVPKDFTYPSVSSYEDAANTLFKIINEHAAGKLVNIFTSYGYAAKPKIYLELRYYNFIEPVGANPTILNKTGNDVLERPALDVKPDAPKTANATDFWS